MAAVKSHMTPHTTSSSVSGASSTYFRDTSLKFEFRSLRSHAPPGVYVAPAAGMPLTWKGVVFVCQCASVVDTLTGAGLTNYMGEQISDRPDVVAGSQDEVKGEQHKTDTSMGSKMEIQGSASSIGYSGWYEGGIFEFRISFPNDYPRSPPQLRFDPPVLHPQIAADGLLVLDGVLSLQEKRTPQTPQTTSGGKGGGTSGGHVIPLLFHVHRMFQTLRPWAPNLTPLPPVDGPQASSAIIARVESGGGPAGEGHAWRGGAEGPLVGAKGNAAAVGNPAAAAMLAHARDDLYAAVRRCVASSVKRAETQARIRAGFWETGREEASGGGRAAQEQRCAEQQAQKEEMVQRVLAGERGRDLWQSVLLTK
ncbi:hypothetical protein CLOM_g18601 [Closterium sp. NIES-68]|nr:hypothetical protein CLOM_g18601 [Closterium sp. NIES-68]GJP86088.1 hypothetical protein CLOP_g16149 [Closterium sp. NIES-67]